MSNLPSIHPPYLPGTWYIINIKITFLYSLANVCTTIKLKSCVVCWYDQACYRRERERDVVCDVTLKCSPSILNYLDLFSIHPPSMYWHILVSFIYLKNRRFHFKNWHNTVSLSPSVECSICGQVYRICQTQRGVSWATRVARCKYAFMYLQFPLLRFWAEQPYKQSSHYWC